MAKCKPSFMKLVVRDTEEAVRFWQDGFGMTRGEVMDFDALKETFVELPDTDFALVLVEWKPARDVNVGNGWGPIGFETDDFDGLLASALAAGATIRIPAGVSGDLRYVIIESPQGHEIEIIQPVAP